jgi:hypothetical protein
MSNYINATATKFIATNCACCGKALVDADSVQTAVGPECRKRHGYGVPTRPADWFAVRTILANFGGDVGAPADLIADETPATAHKLANVLLHRFAANFRTARWVPDALCALGYDKMAERAAKRARVKLGAVTAPAAPAQPAEVRIESRTDRWTFKGREYTREVLAVSSPKDERFIAAVKALPGRRWDADARVWTVPATERPALWSAIKTCFAGLPLVSGKGTTTTIPAA